MRKPRILRDCSATQLCCTGWHPARFICMSSKRQIRYLEIQQLFSSAVSWLLVCTNNILRGMPTPSQPPTTARAITCGPPVYRPRQYGGYSPDCFLETAHGYSGIGAPHWNLPQAPSGCRRAHLQASFDFRVEVPVGAALPLQCCCFGRSLSCSYSALRTRQDQEMLASFLLLIISIFCVLFHQIASLVDLLLHIVRWYTATKHDVHLDGLGSGTKGTLKLYHNGFPISQEI